jgi:hypothetical protein
MSGYQGHNDHYDDGYGHHQGNTDSYYQDEHNQQYYDSNGYDAHGNYQGGEGYYDESYVLSRVLVKCLSWVDQFSLQWLLQCRP